MWKLFNDSHTVYMLKLEQNESDDTSSLLFTDLTYLWNTTFSITELQNNFIVCMMFYSTFNNYTTCASQPNPLF